MARGGDGIYLRGMTWPTTRQVAGQRKRHHEGPAPPAARGARRRGVMMDLRVLGESLK